MTRGHCAILFFAFALFACTKGSFAAMGSEIVSATLQLRVGEPDEIVRGKRYLRSGQSTANEDGDNTEDRAFEFVKNAAGKLIRSDNNPARKPTAADKLFTKFKLDKVSGALMQHPQFAQWSQAVSKKYAKKVESYTAAMLSSLTSRYADEAVANMIAVAKEKGTLETKAIAAKLSSQQVLTWFTDKKSADDVFNLLKLDEAQGPILEKPALKTWLYYANSMGEDPYKILLSKLNSRYGDDGLAQILVPAKREQSTRDVAGKLDDLLLKSWQEEKHSADYVFKLLKLDRQEGNVFYTPEFTTWRSFLARLDSTNPDEAMYMSLKARYGDGGLKDMMNNAEESAETMLVLMKETRKEELGFQEKMSKMVQLQNDAGTTRAVVRGLREEIWRSEGKTADDVYKMLKLNDDLDTVYAAFRKPALGTWASYVTKLHNVDEKNPDVISILERRFSRWPLASVLSTPRTSAAKDLRTLQYKKFLSEGIHPDAIMSRMGGYDDAYLVQWVYRKYYEANRAK